MAWSTPRTWTTGETVTASICNSAIRDNLDYLADPDRARAYRSANLSFADSTWDVVPLGVETFDSNGLHDNSSNSSRITAQADGFYLAIGQVRFLSNSTGDRKVALRKNAGGSSSSGDRLGATIVRAATGDVTEIGCSSLVALQSGDYVEMFAFQSSGGALSIEGGESYNWLSLVQLGVG